MSIGKTIRHEETKKIFETLEKTYLDMTTPEVLNFFPIFLFFFFFFFFFPSLGRNALFRDLFSERSFRFRADLRMGGGVI